MVRTKDLAFSYDRDPRFEFPDIQCNPGKALLVTGSSGRGKTTLLHLLGGLLKPESGIINIDGTDIGQLSAKKLDRFRGRNIGFVLQQSHFIASLSVLENVVLASWLATGKKSTEKAKALLEYLDLSGQMHKLPSRLSTGQQQRVTIARALVNQPRLVLADEPTSSLDDQNTAIVAELLSNLSKESGAALIIVTHDHRLKNRFSETITL